MVDSANSSVTYGRRQIVKYDVTGQPSYTYVALELVDFLNPKAGDEFYHGDDHDRIVDNLFLTITTFFHTNPFVSVYRDVKLVWPSAGISGPAPDIFVVQDRAGTRTTQQQYTVGTDGPLPDAIIEVTSPLFEQMDLEEKFRIYESIGIPEYMVVCLQTSDHPLRLSIKAYRLAAGAYQTIPPDKTGSVRFLSGRADFAVSIERDRLYVSDARSGKRVKAVAEASQPQARIASEANQRARTLASQLNLPGRD